MAEQTLKVTSMNLRNRGVGGRSVYRLKKSLVIANINDNDEDLNKKERKNGKGTRKG